MSEDTSDRAPQRPRLRDHMVVVVVIVAWAAAATGALLVGWLQQEDLVEALLDELVLDVTTAVEPEATAHGGFHPFAAAAEPAVGGELYVPVYSSIFIGDGRAVDELAVTVSVRNTSLTDDMVITHIDYYDGDGLEVERFLSEPHRLAPMATGGVFIEQDDPRGGPGANIVVGWEAAVPIEPPLAEAVMVGSYALRGVTFTSRGVALAPDVLNEADEPEPSAAEDDRRALPLAAPR